MKKTALALALGLGAFLSTQAFAQSTENRFFIDGRVGSASVDEDDFDDEASVFQLNGGYRWGNYGIEVGYVNFDEFAGEVETTGQDFEIDADIDGYTIGVNGRTHFGESPWYLSGRLGAFIWEADSEAVVPSTENSFIVVQDGEDGTDLYAGVGVGYDFSDQFSLGLAYDYFGPGKDEVSLQTNTLSVTGEVRF
jgi:OmpA-OmpF porin, OOP family